MQDDLLRMTGQGPSVSLLATVRDHPTQVSSEHLMTTAADDERKGDDGI